MKSVAILLDGGFITKKIFPLLNHRNPTAQEIYDFAQTCVTKNEELFRIFYYHCLPYEKLSSTQLLDKQSISVTPKQLTCVLNIIFHWSMLPAS